MCDPVTMTVLTVGSIAYQQKQAEDAARRNNKIAEEAYANDIAQLNEMAIQEGENASQELQIANQEGLRRQAALEVSNSTISGSTVNRLSDSLKARQAEDAMTIFTNFDRTISQNSMQRRGARSTLKGRQQQAPNRLGTALKAGIAGSGAYSDAGGTAQVKKNWTTIKSKFGRG